MMDEQYEVEQKFRLVDAADFTARLNELTSQPPVTVEQTDTYFAHPARDFGQTDEAFRLRQVGQQNLLTYKGPKVDQTTKTRLEIELPMPSGVEYAARLQGLLKALGFREVAQVHKRRRKVEVTAEGASVEIAIDDVAGIGCFVELEIAAALSEVEAAKTCLAALAARLGLIASERRSYLELLLQSRESGKPD